MTTHASCGEVRYDNRDRIVQRPFKIYSAGVSSIALVYLPLLEALS
jgi:hypothetical protein